MVSVDDRGLAADDHAYGASVSRDGRWLAFSSRAQNLDRRTRSGAPQVFVRDARSGRGRAVVDTPDTDVFVRDLDTGRVRRASGAATGSVRLSGDARVVALVTTESILVRDTGSHPDVYVLRRGRGLRETWSLPLAQDSGPPTDTGCGWTGLSISRTGRYLTGACADGGVATPSVADKPVHLWWTDRRTGRTRLANRTDDSSSEIDGAQVSDDGRRVFFAGRERGYGRHGTVARREIYEGVFLWQRGRGVRRLTAGDDAWWDDYGFDAAGDGRTVVFASSSNAMAGRDRDADEVIQLFRRRVS